MEPTHLRIDVQMLLSKYCSGPIWSFICYKNASWFVIYWKTNCIKDFSNYFGSLPLNLLSIPNIFSFFILLLATSFEFSFKYYKESEWEHIWILSLFSRYCIPHQQSNSCFLFILQAGFKIPRFLVCANARS